MNRIVLLLYNDYYIFTLRRQELPIQFKVHWKTFRLIE